MNSVVIGTAWFTGRECIGIVLVYDTITKKPKAWIKKAYGYDIESDIQIIRKYGTKFPVEEAVSLVKKIGEILEPDLYNLVCEQIYGENSN